MTVVFQKAAIKIEKAEEFARLQKAVEQAFVPEKAQGFLKQLDRKGIRVRDFDAVLAQRLLEGVAGEQDSTRGSCISRCRCPIRRRCASFTCRSSRASTSRCGTSLKSCTSTIEVGAEKLHRSFGAKDARLRMTRVFELEAKS